MTPRLLLYLCLIISIPGSLSLTACGGGAVDAVKETDAGADGGGPDAGAKPDAGPGGDTGVVVTEDGGVITARSGVIELAIDQDRGTLNIKDTIWGTEITKLHLAVEVMNGPQPRVFTTAGKKLTCDRGGSSDSTSFICTGDVGSGFTAKLTIAIENARPGVLQLGSTFTNAGKDPVTVRKFFPFRTAATAGGAIFLGKDPSSVRILQNGSDEVVDYYVNILPGDTTLTSADENALLAGHSSFSSGSACLHDLDSGASLLAGFTAFEWAIPLVAAAGDKGKAVEAGGRTPMTELWGEARYPWEVAIPPGRTIDGGAAVIVMGAKTPHDALEQYADEVARKQQIVLPPKPLSGWDSWYTEAGDTLTEEYISTSADRLSQSFYAFGLDSMEIDSGWQDAWGDWNARDTFPGGIKAATDHIKKRGLKPEVWMAPLSASEGSQVWLAHPDWFMPKNPYGGVLISSDMHAFDLANPAVIDYIRTLGARVGEFGFESVKMDFAYYSLLSELPPHPDKTNTALYRNAIREYRAAVGKEKYFINIAMCFPNYGLVDAFRIGLDTWPCWNGGADCPGHSATGMSAQGIKPGVAMAARRYWMNGRIWWNHNDQIFLRDVSEEEQRAWVSITALSGGQISLGENPANLTSRQAALYQSILPLTGQTARPIDLFTKDVPEIWHLRVPEPSDAHIIALYNWGANRDLSTNPYTDRADGAPVTHAVDLGSLGMEPGARYIAYEYWTGQVVDDIIGTFTMEVPPHASRIYRVVKHGDGAQFLATDRHILMGPGFVRGASWNPATSKFTGMIKSTTEQRQFMYVLHPPEFNDTFTQVSGVKNPQSGGIATSPASVYYLAFTGQDNDWHAFEVTFLKK